MADMKCPVCDKPMKQATYDYDKKDNNDTLYMSIMPCDCVCNFAASKAVWQELIRTRKALYLAFEMLKDIKNDPDTNDELTQEIADRLDEITATLEQKE